MRSLENLSMPAELSGREQRLLEEFYTSVNHDLSRGSELFDGLQSHFQQMDVELIGGRVDTNFDDVHELLEAYYGVTFDEF